jgi:hypothetical protein
MGYDEIWLLQSQNASDFSVAAESCGGAIKGRHASVASFEMVAWDNSSGLYPTWSLASVAWMNELIAAGKSTEFILFNIGGQTNSPPLLFPGVTSFDMYFVFIPEPSLPAFAGLGAAAFLILRRRK